HCCAECIQISCWKWSHFHLRIGDDVRGFAFRQERAICPQQFVTEMHHRLADIFQMRANDNLIIVTGRQFVAAAGIDYGNEASVMLFHVAIRKPQLAQQFDPSNFKPDEVVGMVNHAHLIGFSVAHSQSALADYRFAHSLGAHLPLQRGLRFSKNDETPSRKSSVVRMRALSSMAWLIWESKYGARKPLINFLVRRTDEGLFCKSSAATCRACSISLSCSTISLTSP